MSALHDVRANEEHVLQQLHKVQQENVFLKATVEESQAAATEALQLQQLVVKTEQEKAFLEDRVEEAAEREKESARERARERERERELLDTMRRENLVEREKERERERASKRENLDLVESLASAQTSIADFSREIASVCEHSVHANTSSCLELVSVQEALTAEVEAHLECARQLATVQCLCVCVCERERMR